MPRPLRVLAIGLALLAVTGCTRKAPPEAVAGPREFGLTGEVVGFAPERKTVIVHHEEIPGYMPPMTMEFAFEPADRAKLVEGKMFRAKLVDDGEGNLRLHSIEPVDALKEREVRAAAALLRQDTSIRGKSAYREVGETVPTFTLYNQDGEVVPISRFRGQRVVLNFIYTRCPIATMCPASTQRMLELQQAAKAKGVQNLQLVSITLDPAYDTPGVLHGYAAARGIDTANFMFLTGPEGAVRDLLHQFGVIVQPGDAYLKHTLATLLIDEKGKIIHRVDGTQWRPAEFLDRL